MLINPHWGDTVPNAVTASGLRLKMDLRLMDFADNNIPNYGCDEVVVEVFRHKYYKVKLKTIIAAKTHLNQILECHNSSLTDIPSITCPFILISGYEVSLYSMYIPCPGLYFLDSLRHAWFPTTNDATTKHEIRNTLALLGCYVELCTSVKARSQEERDSHKVHSRKMMNDLTGIFFVVCLTLSLTK
ncbi:predicted protein [Lichtheimia corymbifera JMRC:FSU:9682]|uniref:Uncharacterized protein n=1 Tax=Lichtheimia corymbifera JMRC:FSU:9682 TaxID=1263082 RepID=A0A068RL14_9FUNG|nr:predicted protein [Lichtheimia corymbifera JMRC:FSU:9682]